MFGFAAVAATPTPARADADAPEYTSTKTLTRTHVAVDGSDQVVDSRTVTVTVDTTQNLRGRERVHIAWTGARPSAGRAVNPYGFGGMNQEYPVVILQCRGLDDPSLPPAQQLQPETCWTTTYPQRYTAVSPTSAVWLHDRFATEAERQDQDSATSWPDECVKFPAGILSQHLLPYQSAKGTRYLSCNDTTIAPESSIDAALPAADVAAFTGLDGTGDIQFEVRSDAENESLGCSSAVPCSIVVIPIMGISCIDADAGCRQSGYFAPGSSNFTNLGANEAVSPMFWWSASNWRNRFAVPLTFGLPPDACDVLDDRAPVDMFGSELLSQASLQWSPAYCLRSDRFKFRHNRMSEPSALRLLATGGALAAFVSEPATTSAVPLGYAPVAVTGFAVAFVSDKPNNAGEVTQLKLTPRLLAKMLTQSYPASNSGRGHPGMENNPLNFSTDPEFTALNPGLSLTAEEVRSTVLSLSESSDVMTALTSYIAADKEAMDFIAGTPDPSGMLVNPSYKEISLPVAEWPLLDTWVRESTLECEQQIQTPYLSLVAAPVSSLRKAAEAVLDGWPNVQTACSRATPSDPWKFGRVARQGYGNRFMLAIVSLGDAARYGLRTAELRTSGTGTGASFVAPSATSMGTAVADATQSAPGEPFVINREALPADAYPGTMIVHATARLTGLPTADAGHLAQFVRVASTEGQVVGSANGELPEGYLSITSSGSTAALYASSQAVATAFEAQTGVVAAPASNPTATPTPTPTPAPTAGPTTSAGTSPLVTAIGGAAPAAGMPTVGDVASTPVDGLAAESAPEAAVAAPATTTMVQRSTAAGAVIPATLGVVLAGAAGAPLLRGLSTRRRTR